jgi:transposase
VTERLRVREIDDDEGRRLVRIVRRGSGSVVTWRRAQMVLLSAQGMDVAAIAKVAFTSEDRVRDVIRNFNADSFSSLYPKYKGGRPPKFTLGQRREVKKIAKSKPAEHGLPFSAWSLSKLAEFLVAGGVVGGISRGPAHAAPRGRRHLSTSEDLEGLEGPGLCGEESPASSTCTPSPTAR